MTEPLNLYGDHLSPTTGQHGSNISEQRIDELDQACLAFVEKRMAETGACQTVDIGAGSGAQSKRMASLGASVLMIDLTDQHKAIAGFNASLNREAIRFVQKDVLEFQPHDWPKKIDCVYSQRMLGGIPYAEAMKLLQSLCLHATTNAHFFLSTSGMDSEYCQGYPDIDKQVEQRWAKLTSAIGEKHNVLIHQCLYREADFRQLLEQAGLTVVRSWTSAFGNIKATGRKS